MIACSIVESRFDYCNSLLAGTSEANFAKLQCVQNTLARVLTRTNSHGRVKQVVVHITGRQAALATNEGTSNIQASRAGIQRLPALHHTSCQVQAQNTPKMDSALRVAQRMEAVFQAVHI